MDFFTKTSRVFDELQEVGAARLGLQQLNQAIESVISAFYPIESYLYLCINRPSFHSDQFNMVSNLDADRLEKYKNPSLADVNPFINHAHHSNLPHLWKMPENADPKMLALIGQLTEDQHIIEDTFSVPIHGQYGETSIFSAEIKNGALLSKMQLDKLFGEMSYFTLRLHHLLSVQIMEAPTFQITPRQSEILRWTAMGKNSNAIATILEVSENTVHKHLNGARSALNCESTTQAVAIALENKLIKLSK